MRTTVEPGFAAAHWPGEDRLHASPAWLAANLTRPGPAPHTVYAHDRDGAAAVLCYVNTGPVSEAYDLVATTIGHPLTFPWRPEGLPRLAAALAGHPSLARVLAGNVTAVLPGYDHAVTRAGGTDEHLRAVVGGVLELARSAGAAACAFLYVPRDATGTASVLAGHGFIPVALTSRGRLPVRWHDLAGYTAALPKRRREHVRTELRRVAGRFTSTLADPAGSVATITGLRCAHLTKFGRTPDPVAERARLAGLLEGFPDSAVHVVLTEHAGEPVACLVLLRWGGTVHVALAATDPRPRLPLAHFENAYYAPIRLGLTRPGDVVDYGISHLDAKVWRGCVAQPLDAWVRASDPATMAALRQVSVLSMRYSREAPARSGQAVTAAGATA